MPLMRIDMIKGRSKEEIRKILDIAYQAASEEFHLLPRDRFQIVTQHEPDEMVIEDIGLGFTRTNQFLMFSITSSPRQLEDKKRFYNRLVKELQQQVGVSPENVMINITCNTKEDWSFGLGEPQFLNGNL